MFVLTFVLMVCQVHLQPVRGFADEVKSGTIKVRLVTKTESEKAVGAPVKAYQIADWNPAGSFTLTRNFAESEISVDLEQLASELEKGAREAAAWVERQRLSPNRTETSDANGEAIFTDLPLGMYLFVVDDYTTGSGTFTVAPFLLSIPRIENGVWIYEVKSLPKAEFEPLPPDNPPGPPDNPPEPPDNPPEPPDNPPEPPDNPPEPPDNPPEPPDNPPEPPDNPPEPPDNPPEPPDNPPDEPVVVVIPPDVPPTIVIVPPGGDPIIPRVNENGDLVVDLPPGEYDIFDDDVPLGRLRVYEDGSYEFLNDEDVPLYSPRTGDRTRILVLLGVMTAAAVAASWSVVSGRRKREE